MFRLLAKLRRKRKNNGGGKKKKKTLTLLFLVLDLWSSYNKQFWQEKAYSIRLESGHFLKLQKKQLLYKQMPRVSQKKNQ